MAISDKLNYLIETKSKFKDRLNSLGAEIIESTTFRNYLNWLDNFYTGSANKTDLAKNGVVGRTSQETTTGKNSYNINVNYDWVGADTTYTITGNTINVNGKYFVAGLHSVKQNTNYTISATRQIIQDNSTCGTIRAFTPDKSQMLGEGKTTFTFNTGNNNQVYVLLYAGLKEQGNINFSNIQLEEGNSATSFEPFTNGASPNPDYPQEINNLSGDVEYKVRGKNLFDKDNANILKGWFRDATAEMILKSGSADRIIAFKGKPNTTYTISKKLSNRFRVDLYNSLLSQDGTYTFNYPIIKNDSGTNITVTTTTTDYYIYIHVYQSSDGDFQAILNSIQIEYGNSASSYQPYQSASYPISLGDIELCKIGDYQDKIAKSTGKNLFDISAITENYTLTEGGQGGKSTVTNTSDYIKVSANQSYTFSYDYTTLANSAYRAYNIYNNSKTYISGSLYSPSSKTITITPLQDGYIRISYDKNCYGIQLEKGTATSYEPYGTNWYLNKQIGKVVLNGTENWTVGSSATNRSVYSNQTTFTNRKDNNSYSDFFSDNFSYLGNAQGVVLGYAMSFNSGQYARFIYVQVPLDVVAQGQVDDFKNWLSTHNTTVYYILATPTYTEITQENYPTLYSQLLAIQEFLTKYKINKEFLLDYSSPEIEY